MPKSPKRTVSVGVPLISFPDRVAVAFHLASRSTPWIESVPVSWVERAAEEDTR